MTEPELDHRLAAKLREAAEHEPYTVLDEAARARVLRALQSEPVRARRMPWMQISMAVAAAALFAVLIRKSGPACELPTEVAFAEHTLDLGRFGKVVLDADADARLSKTAACELEITLAHGTLAAALHDLKPARLSVRTPLGAVEVRGTTFSVAYGDTLEVVLLEGAVALQHEHSTTTLAPGNALTRSDARSEPRTAPLAPAQERRLRRLLAPEPVVAPAPSVEAAPEPVSPEPTAKEAPPARQRSQSATELLAAAERERRAGEPARARALYREAGSAAGGDAEVALLRWARLELDEQPQAALDVLARYRARYGKKLERARLGAEASFLEVQVLEKLGRRDEARQRAHELVQRYPNSPQGRAAASW